MNSLREKVFEYIKEKYGVEAEYPWLRFPNCCVFRHKSNNKWFGLIMNIPYSKLGLKKEGVADILNIKVHDLFLRDLLVQQEGIFPGYHIARGNWISILLDETVDLNQIRDLIDEGYSSTKPKKKKASFN